MNLSNQRQTSNRQMKSSVFTTYSSDPKNAAQLYTALEGLPAEPDDIEYTTLEGVLLCKIIEDCRFDAEVKEIYERIYSD